MNVVVTNNGPGNVTPQSVTTIPNGEFTATLSSDNVARCNTSFLILEPTESCVMQVTFTPTELGSRLATLRISFGGGSTLDVTLSGIGISPRVDISPGNFGSVAVGSSTTQSVTVRNTGTSPILLQPLSQLAFSSKDFERPNFNVPAECNFHSSTELEPTESCQIGVKFTPSAVGARSGTLTISDSIGTKYTAALSGTGTLSGYWMLGGDGKVYPFGDVRDLGEPSIPSGRQAVDLEPTRSGAGYWIVDSLGTVTIHGDAVAYGSVDRTRLSFGEVVTSMSSTATGGGYWIFTNRGRVVGFGDARFLGDMSNTVLNGPVLDSIPTPSGQGYYMVASDGGIFAFGDAQFHGSMGGKSLNAPVQSLVPDGDGVGYWLVASDGGIFAFEAKFGGSMGGTRLNAPVTGMVRFGSGYLMVGVDGGIFNFSDRQFYGSLGSSPPAVGISAVAAIDA